MAVLSVGLEAVEVGLQVTDGCHQGRVLIGIPSLVRLSRLPTLIFVFNLDFLSVYRLENSKLFFFRNRSALSETQNVRTRRLKRQSRHSTCNE